MFHFDKALTYTEMTYCSECQSSATNTSSSYVVCCGVGATVTVLYVQCPSNSDRPAANLPTPHAMTNCVQQQQITLIKIVVVNLQQVFQSAKEIRRGHWPHMTRTQATTLRQDKQASNCLHIQGKHVICKRRKNTVGHAKLSKSRKDAEEEGGVTEATSRIFLLLLGG